MLKNFLVLIVMFVLRFKKRNTSRVLVYVKLVHWYRVKKLLTLDLIQG